ncbi:MAG: hypothetical protein IPM29_17760 [Planctomycetes bacterium]|nr:hypothetical protein [Planctomycetota bacterium]
MRTPTLTVLLLAPAIPAQLTWNTLAPPTRPAASESYAMAETSGPPSLLLFGGTPAPSTWRLSQGAWTRLAPLHQPSSRTRTALAYDPVRDRVVLFGGELYSAPFASDETWEWNGQDWSLLQPANRPPARAGASLAFDPGTGRLVLFGGFGGRFLDDTWSFDGSDWTRLQTTYQPPPRANSAMAHDRTGIVLFGGSDAFGALDDAWRLESGAWRRLSFATRPSARQGHSMTWDADRRRIVLHGGYATGLDVLADTWELDAFGLGFSRVATAVPGPRVGDHAAAYDPQRRAVVVFGGATVVSSGGSTYRVPVDTTAEYVPTVRASIAQISLGCGGIDSMFFAQMPLLGELGFTFGIAPVIGAQRIPTVAGLSLAQQVPPLSFGRCQLHLATPIAVVSSPAFPPGSFTLPIPANPALRGLTFYVQVIGEEFLAGAGQNGVGFSPAYRLTIGD